VSINELIPRVTAV